MKYLLILILLSGCIKQSEVAAEPSTVICEGKFTEQSPYLIIMQCNDGRIATFQSYRTSFGKNVVNTK